MRVITLLNEKGGVGKSTLAVTLAAGLAVRGYRVILVDADPQGTASEAFGYEPSPGFYDLMMRDTTRYQDVIYQVDPSRYAPQGTTPTGRLYALPGNEESRSVGDMQRDAYRVLRRLAPLVEIADVIVFDTSPTPSRLNTLVLSATDDVIVPTQLERWSFKGVQKSLSALTEANQTRRADGLPDVNVMAYVPTMTQLGTSEHASNHNELTSTFDAQVWRPIPRRIVWGECASARLSVFAYANDTEAAADGWRLVEQVENAL